VATLDLSPLTVSLCPFGKIENLPPAMTALANTLGDHVSTVGVSRLDYLRIQVSCPLESWEFSAVSEELTKGPQRKRGDK
jgi:hypothetical protein